MAERWTVRHRDDVPGVACPCGTAHRILTAADDPTLSVHLVEARHDSAAHWHQRLTEIYVIVRGEGELELDGHRVPVREGSVARIPPGVRHRAVPGPGGLTFVNLVQPPFDPEDEHHD